MNVSVAMNSDTVKPMPPSIDTAAIIFQLLWSGIGAAPSLTVSHEKLSIPTNLPATRARITASDTPSITDAGSVSSRNMPALAKANSGTMK